MNILLIGSGGREHALAWKISQSPLCDQLYIAPGNPGTAQCGINIPMSVNDFESQKFFCLEHHIDMVVVGPEDPLVNGLYDFFQTEETKHIHVIGPSKEGAQLEGSKAFSKTFMMEEGIPTASYRKFTSENFDEGITYLRNHSLPVVLKADGLAAGKGVVIAQTTGEAITSFREMLVDQKFGKAGSTVVVEQFLEGIECSVFVLTDGEHYVILPEAKDYKRIGEGDQGLNTGGMGAVSPVPFANEDFMKKVDEKIIQPTVKGLAKRNIDYKGFIFFGLIKVNEKPYVIEYNCRMGDPETEVVIPRIEEDIVPLFAQLKNKTLRNGKVAMTSKAAATVMLVSEGYPGDYEKGKMMTGLADIENSLVFHAGTKEENGRILTNGGRVVAITSLGNHLKETLEQSLSNATRISYDGKYYRRDIGYEFL